MKILVLAAALSLFGTLTRAHEGHDSPGALPPPPNGGQIAEAAHNEEHDGEDGEHDHDGGHEERELFAEAKLEGAKVRVSALGIDPKDPKVWQLLVPGPMLSVIEAKVELPRSKKILPLTLRATKGEWVGEIADLKAYRLFVVVTFMDGGEKKRAKIQIEREP